MTSHILIQTVAVPILAAVIILFSRSSRGRHAGWVCIAALVYTTIILAGVWLELYQGGPVLNTWYLGPEMSLDLLADGLSLPVALVVNLICLALAIYSTQYVDHRIVNVYPGSGKKKYGLYYKRFFFLYLFFPAGFMGVAFSTNLLSIYLFLELLTIIPLYFIMAQFGYSDYISRYKVALICLFWGVAGASLFLIGILLGFNEIGSFEISEIYRLSVSSSLFWVIVFILAGLFTKLAVVPLHAWMPLVHAEHPTCIAGLLAIYANIAVYILVRVLILPLPNEMPAFRAPLMVMAVITMVYGACLTLAQTDIKRFCACSTISQISYSLFGVSAMTIMGIEGGMFYFLSHILGKAILFSTAGMLVYSTHTRDMRKMGGLWRKMPLTALLWMVAALILSALPPTIGFVGKWMLFAGAFEAMAQDPEGMLLVIFAILSTLLTLVYTFSAGLKIFFGSPKMDIGHIKDPPLAMGLPILFLALFSILLGIYPGPVLNFFSLAVAGT